MHILVTGAAGFIGFHLSKRLIENNFNVIGFDNLNSYYDVNLKLSRIKELKKIKSNNQDYFKFFKGSLQDEKLLNHLFEEYNPSIVINMAAQAGVRYSINHPKEYIDTNLKGFLNLLECCRKKNVKHLIYASSSSVYGGNTKIPFSEDDNVNHPISLYAATKKSNELMAHTYSHLFGLPTTGLRLFTVYGPWGRPDMALFKFTKSILNGKPIKIFNNGKMKRDFTYIDDVIECIIKIINKYPKTTLKNKNKNYTSSESWAPYKIFNIGNSNPVDLMLYIKAIEKELDIKAIKEFEPMQDGDVMYTFADTKKLQAWINIKPMTEIEYGIKNFVDWYKSYFMHK